MQFAFHRHSSSPIFTYLCLIFPSEASFKVYFSCKIVNFLTGKMTKSRPRFTFLIFFSFEKKKQKRKRLNENEPKKNYSRIIIKNGGFEGVSEMKMKMKMNQRIG